MNATTTQVQYIAPDLELSTVELTEDEFVWWAVILGGSYALALAYAAYCTSTHGHPSIGFGWSGFKVACNS